MSVRTTLLLLFAPALILLGPTRPAEAQNRTTSGTEALDATGTVVVDNHEGRIIIETWDRAEVQYEAVVRPEDGAEHPEATTVRVDQSPSRFVLRTAYDASKADAGGSDWFGGDGTQNVMPVAYTLTVPRGARVEIEDHESDVRVQGLDGEAALDTHDGDVTLTDQGGDATIASHDGPITVENQSGALTIDTHDSDVRLRSVDGRVEIDAHDSDIEAEGLRGGLDVDTHEGDGRFAFAELAGDVTIETHDGDVTLTLPAGAGVDLRTDFGDEDADLRADVDLAPYRVSDGDEDDAVNYAGSLNGGGPRLSLNTHEGTFTLRTR
jgi:hypothetical protein